MSSPLIAFGVGIGTKNRSGSWLEVFFPAPLFKPDSRRVETVAEICGYQGGNQVISLEKSMAHALAGQAPEFAFLHANARPAVVVFLAADTAPDSVPEAYLKLHLLSHRLVRPHGLNLTGIFKVLPNVVWTSAGAVDIAEIDEVRLSHRLRGETLVVHSVDKFPRLTDYVIPKGVRIADASRVRLGAYLGEGTTIMHEGFVNYNAGTEGPNMVEGRISAGVFVGAGTDVGGGASTMGTLSGGNDIVISLGRNCLLGANSGVGIPLGEDCTVEAGLYLTAGSKVLWSERAGAPARTVKARDLAGKANLLFRRNSLTGAIECIPNKNAIQLNETLHSNN